MASPVFVSAVTTSSAGSETTGGQPRRAVAVADERKRKRKESNRLSAQRSRARKQLQVDELAAEAAALRARNGAMATAAHEAIRRCAAVEAENQFLLARTLELGARLDSLVDLIQCMEATAAFADPFAGALPQPTPLLDAAMYGSYHY